MNSANEPLTEQPPHVTDAGSATASTVPLARLRDYEFLEKLGQGGMGTVYKARHLRLGRIVAVKVLSSDRIDSADAISRFQREMLAVGGLRHPNIIEALDAGEADGTHYLALEYVDGLDVGTLAKRLGALPIPDACEIIRQAALGLQHAHEHGLVHRDVKPSNLLVTQSSLHAPREDSRLSPDGGRALNAQPTSDVHSAPGSLHAEREGYIPEGDIREGRPLVKVLDLGLARLSGHSHADDLTSTGQVMGTLDYIAPEQVEDAHHVDIRADIYSLGCTLYRLLVGEAPFSGPQYTSAFKKMMAHHEQPLPPVRDKRPDVPTELAATLDRMVAKRADDRFSTPADVAAALASWSAGSDLTALLHRASQTGGPSAPVATSLTKSPVSSEFTDTHRPHPQPAAEPLSPSAVNAPTVLVASPPLSSPPVGWPPPAVVPPSEIASVTPLGEPEAVRPRTTPATADVRGLTPPGSPSPDLENPNPKSSDFLITEPPTSIADATRRRSQHARRVNRIVGVAVAVAVLVLGWMYGAQVIRIVTGKGLLVIEADEDAIEVTIKQGETLIKDKQTDREYVLKEGDQYTVEVTETTSGLSFKTEAFSIIRGGRKVLDVRKDMADRKEARRMAAPGRHPLPANAETAAKPTVTSQETKTKNLATAEGGHPTGHPTDPDRAAAEWVLSLKAAYPSSVEIQMNCEGGGAKKSLGPGTPLSSEPFRVTGISVSSPRDGADVSDAQVLRYIAPLRSLQILRLEGCAKVTDASVPSIKQLSTLKELYVGRSKLSGAACYELATALPLIWIGVSTDQFTDELAEFIRTTPRITTVNVMGGNDAQLQQLLAASHITYLVFASQASAEMATWRELPDRLPNLTALIVTSAGITDAHLSEFARCPKLIQLSVQNTPVTDAGLMALHGCRTLRTLDLTQTKVTAEGVTALHAALPNCRITWDGGVIEPAP